MTLLELGHLEEVAIGMNLEADPMGCKLRRLGIPTIAFERIHYFFPRCSHCIRSHCQHRLLIRYSADFLRLFLTMALFDQAIQVLWCADLDMLGHEVFLRRGDLPPPLKLLTFIGIEPIVPIDRFLRKKAQICLPSHHGVAVLDYIRPLLRRKVLLPAQEIVPEKEV